MLLHSSKAALLSERLSGDRGVGGTWPSWLVLAGLCTALLARSDGVGESSDGAGRSTPWGSQHIEVNRCTDVARGANKLSSPYVNVL